MTTDVETADEELLRRVKAELEQPVEAEVSQTSIDYYHQNKDIVGQTLLFIFQMSPFTSHQNQNPVPILIKSEAMVVFRHFVIERYSLRSLDAICTFQPKTK